MAGIGGRMVATGLALAAAGFLMAEAAIAADASAPSRSTAREEAETRSLFDAWRKLDAPQRPTVSLPARRPLDSFRYTSPFGVRSDPFRGVATQHNGIDLAAPTGTPVHATADGLVTEAGAASGYGNLVQLDHGAGIQTRYGHLSRIMCSRGSGSRRATSSASSDRPGGPPGAICITRSGCRSGR